MAGWRRITRTIDGFSDRIGKVAGWLILGMVMIGSYNTLARYFDGWRGTHRSATSTHAGETFFRFSSNSFLELQWYLFSIVFLLGAAYALRQDAHVRVDVFYGRLGRKGQAWINLVGGVGMLLPFSIACLILSWPAVRNSWAVHEQSPDPGGLARYPIKALLLVAFALLIAQGISEILKAIAILRSPEEGGEGMPEPPDGGTAARDAAARDAAARDAIDEGALDSPGSRDGQEPEIADFGGRGI